MFYGGAAGGGKSFALLAGALQYVDVPGYHALLLRRTFADLAKPRALMDLSHQLLAGTAARWDGNLHRWTFPSGATLSFGYLANENDKYQYASAAYQYIAFDEVTQFLETQYRYLFSRLRREAASGVPLRVRAAGNPDGVGFEWVKRRFVAPGDPSRPFVPARLEDNPHLDRDAYDASLALLDPITRMRLRHGDWTARGTGGLFRREWFEVVDDWPRDAVAARFWDFAATEETEGSDPDWTVGVRGVARDGVLYVTDVRRDRLSPLAVERLIAATAAVDGPEVAIEIETEPGSSGKIVLDHYQRHVLPGYAVTGDRPTGDAVTRAKPLSAASEAGNVKLVRGPWLEALFDELELFPTGAHDDQVIALAGLHRKLLLAPRIQIF